MRERWAAIPDFQRTRGALRFLAACLRASHREGKSRAVLGPGDVALHDAEVRLAFFKEVGQQADFQAVLEHDLIGANARSRRIDDRRAKEFPAEVGKRPATRLATAILMYSFGGLRREGGQEGELLPPGVTEADLLSACVGPDLDSTTAQACLKELKEQCLYLHYDGVRYCFKKDPNVTLLVEQEAGMVARDESRVRDRIKELLEARLAGRLTAILWPEKSGEIPDKDPSFLVAYLPLEFAAKPRDEQETLANEMCEKYGDRPRSYRNGLGLAIPSADQVEPLRHAVRYLLATEQVKAKAKQYNLTEGQKDQLKERESTERRSSESALLKLYLEVWLPRVEGGAVVVEKVTQGNRPLQITLNEKKEALIHERVMEVICTTHRRVHGTLEPKKIVELFRLGEGTPPAVGIQTAKVLDGFYSFLGFTRLTTATAIRKAVVLGIAKGLFGYVAGSPPTLGPEGKYQVALEKIHFATDIAEDEVDLDSGFLIMPSALPKPRLVEPLILTPTESPTPTAGLTTGPTPVEETPKPLVQKVVELSFTADKDQIFKAWNAIANLAEYAGKVSVVVRAEKPEGFDRTKLQNGVMEPLREADLIE